MSDKDVVLGVTGGLGSAVARVLVDLAERTGDTALGKRWAQRATRSAFFLHNR